MSLQSAIRSRIRQLCRENCMTLNALSSYCGITQSTMNNIVTGRNHSTRVSTLQKICDGLDISLVEFFDCELFRDAQ